MRAISHEIAALTQNPNPFDIKSPVVRLAEVQLVSSMPIQIDAIHINRCHFTHPHPSEYFARLVYSVSTSDFYQADFLFANCSSDAFLLPQTSQVGATPNAPSASPLSYFLNCPDPPIIVPQVVKINKKVETIISLAIDFIVILPQHQQPKENWQINDRQLTYADTKAVVSRLFCLLKLRHCMIGKRTRIIDVITLIQRVLPQLSPFPNRMYPQILRKMAIPSEITVNKTSNTIQDEFPSSYLRTSLIPAKQKRSIRTTDYLNIEIMEIYLLA